MWRPLAVEGGEPYEIYCVEPGSPLRTPHISKEQIEAYEGRTYTRSCGHHASWPLKKSDPYYYCSNNHVTEKSKTVYGRTTNAYGEPINNTYDIAYIVSFFPYGQDGGIDPDNWSGGKQYAIWKSSLSYRKIQNRIFNEEYITQGKSILAQSKIYQKMVEDMDKNNGKVAVQKTKEELEEMKDNLKIDTDQSSKLHKIGPFSIDYIYGWNSNYPSESSNAISQYAMSGISDMYLEDEDGNRIDINAFIRPGIKDIVPNQSNNTSERTTATGVGVYYGEPKFWNYYSETGKENPNKVDYWSYNNWRNYPAPNEKFYVEFEYYGKLPPSLKLKVKFKYLDIKFLACAREGTVYVTEVAEDDDDYNHHTHCVDWEEDEDGHSHCVERDDFYGCKITLGVGTEHNQNLVYVDYERKILEDEMEIPFDTVGATTMKVGGFVFEDSTAGKEEIANGLKDDNDVILPNVEVTLYEVTASGKEKLAKLESLENEFPNQSRDELEDLYPDDYKRRINPTLTDENGYYEFRGVNRSKRYAVKFTYNGQTYLPTEYLGGDYDSVDQMVDDDEYESADNSSSLWRETSKGLEKVEEREDYTDRFSEIGALPKNYPSTDSLREVGDYNVTFSQYELMGFELQKDGSYRENDRKRLIDSYLYVENGKIVTDRDRGIREGIISKRIKEYIDDNEEYPDDIKDDIYRGIVNSIGGDRNETWQKLQYIEDCKIHSYTINYEDDDDDYNYDRYPVYNEFTTYVSDGNKYPENSYEDGTFDEDVSEYEDHILEANGIRVHKYYKYTVAADGSIIQEETTEDDPLGIRDTSDGTVGEVKFRNVYPGQLYINQGLWRRQEADLALQKDIYKAAVKINGKTQVYDYDSYGHGIITAGDVSKLKKEYTKDGIFDEAGFKTAIQEMFKQKLSDSWDVHVRLSDYENYYNTIHNRAIYRSDYNYVTLDGRTGAALEVYITYKIGVRNQSQSILGEVTEVVDYYDEDYDYVDELSWITWDNTNTNNKDENYIDSEEYYNMMDNIGNGGTAKNNIQNYKDTSKRNNTRYDRDTESDITNRTIKDGNTGNNNKYKSLYIDGLEGKKLSAGETAYIYLTFKIKTNSDGTIIINNSNGENKENKKNIAEINGYRTYYKDNTRLPNSVTVGSRDFAGLVDVDSKPGNLEAKDLEEQKYESNFEDDTDRAKDLHIYVDDNAERKLNGTVWEDQRNTNVNGSITGDGIRKNNENTISGVKVELYEIEVDVNGNPIKNADGSTKLKSGPIKVLDGDWMLASKKTGDKGQYEFTGFIPGDYIVRFTYGGNDSNTTYNGQDFKSTSYQAGIDQNGKTDNYVDKNVEGKYDSYTDTEKQNETGTYGYNIAKSDANTTNYSDAKDIWSIREKVNKYSNNNGNGVTNGLAQTLSNHSTANSNTEMVAETGAIVAELEYNRQNSNAGSGDKNYNNDDTKYLQDNYINTKYELNNVDLGLVERPKAQLELNKKITNVKLTLANGQILFDNTAQGPNISWTAGKAYEIWKKKTEQGNNIYETDYTNKKTGERYKDDNAGHGTEYYQYRKELITDKFTQFASSKNYNGLIQMTMDEELMHGATIRIQYQLTVTNAGEVDYDGKGYYYENNKYLDGQKAGNLGNTVTTTANQVLDYVSNNMTFRQDDNNGIWSVISTDNVINTGLVNSTVAGVIKKNNINQYNSIIQTTALNKMLKPGEAISTDLVLSQVITSQNTTDDLTYDNITEIVKTSNTVGRRMAYSVAGNQDPTKVPTEVDTAKSERVTILPPFGNITYIYILIGIATLGIVVAGIVLIKKKILDKK